MRRIEGQITKEILQFIGQKKLDKADAFPVSTYRQLVEHVAKLAYLNKDHLLFFRGQGVDYRNRVGASTFYPTIYRGDYLLQKEINNRFRLLEHASRKLREIFEDEKIQGYEELMWKKYIQWSILQHYEVCDTPLLDLTHSVRVACSFAQIGSQDGIGFIYAFGLPYIMNRVSHNSEHDIVNVRLLSICPPEALRPYFQEGYLAGTEDITNEYDSKDNLDFRNRLIAKFQIPGQSKFWGRGFSMIPASVLYPKGDRIGKLCNELSLELKSQLLPGQLGEFLQEWAELETYLVTKARDREKRVFSIIEAINVLASAGAIERDLVYELHEMRKFRNMVIHEPKKISPEQIEDRITQVQKINQQLLRGN
jgi:uncharacterized protein YutE (UPF0331/DUF86 family)